MSVTWHLAFRSCNAAFNPANPPPTMTTFGRSSLDRAIRHLPYICFTIIRLDLLVVTRSVPHSSSGVLFSLGAKVQASMNANVLCDRWERRALVRVLSD